MRRAIVTGAGSGIGRATALLLAAQRWHVFACDVDDAAVARTAVDARGEVKAIAVDITDDAALGAVVAGAGERSGVQAIVHCAALFPRIGIGEAVIGDFDRVMAVNLRAAVHLALMAIPVMRGGGGMVFLTSGSGLLAAAADPFQIGFALYGASKAGLDRWVAGVAPELAPLGIFASTITPGAFVATPGLARGGIVPPAGAQSIAAEKVAEAIRRIVEDRSGKYAGQRLNAVDFA